MGKYFTINELCKSDTAKRNNIDNVATNEVIKNLNTLINTLDIIREEYGAPITITSGYRCYLLNKKVGGSNSSQHLKGEAADITAKDMNKLWNIINKLIQNKTISVDQLINEKNLSWIHISTKESNNRNMIFALS